MSSKHKEYSVRHDNTHGTYFVKITQPCCMHISSEEHSLSDQNGRPQENKNDLADKVLQLTNEIKSFEKKEEKILSDLNKRAKIVITIISALACITVFLLATNYLQPHQGLNSDAPSDYAIQDAQGGKISTWIAWKIVDGQIFHIHVAASSEVTDHRMQIIRDVIFSNQTVQVGNSVYYKGWEGAMMAASQSKTEFPIPVHFHTVITNSDVGRIVINLTDMENPNGLTGLTRSIVDPMNHEILKSQITIYGIGKLSDDQLAMLLRHELGHAFGLAYSDDPSDIMHLVIDKNHPYISNCDIKAIDSLYNGSEHNEVTCST